MPYPQNQVTVRSSETGDVFRISRSFAERQDTLTILDDEPRPVRLADTFWRPEWPEGSIGYDVEVAGSDDNTPIKSVDKPADPIAAPVADDK